MQFTKLLLGFLFRILHSSNTVQMKTRLYFVLIAIMVIPILHLSSCNKVKQITAFDVLYTLPTTISTFTPSSMKNGEELLYSGSIEANLDSILHANGFDPGVVGNTQFIECTVSIVQPSTVTFGWLQSARGEISDNPEFIPAREVGTVVNDDPEATTVVLILNNTNIRPYLGATFFYFRVFGELNGPVPAEWIDLAINGKLLMHLEPLN